ncbi:ribonuclease D [Abditibacterium utsteinense]|uniref:Ribonuclease D n=1 Tax=Abditibacterium utsteinense TaxID=1960156 RepID=A0A2S8SVH9_9BACT|nr:ribonuclease D [Abditibacterium utsteinense]PQV64792.1 ribonuclease D [Abditibacterium utsteinense]
MLISRQAELDSFVQKLQVATKNGAPLAFDTEFLSEKRYFARLCLVQVLAPIDGGVIEAAIDPFDLDLSALFALIADPNITKIVHSGSSDLQILWQSFGIEAKNVFDTQIAAAFLGYGHQIGYADMVRKITATNLSKTMQYTDWSARPLSDEQIEYALADVRYLPPVYAQLKGELERRNRLSWAITEFERGEKKAVRVMDDAESYKRLNPSGLTRKQLAVLREIAKVREEMARAADKPPSFIVPDLAVLQMARQQPKNLSDLRAIRGMPGIPDQNAKRLLDAVKVALESDPESWPAARSGERPDPRLESIVALLGVVATARATAQDVSRNYLAPRDALFDLANDWLKSHESNSTKNEETPEELAILQDWRGEILGRDLLELLNGNAVIALDKETGLPDLRANSS